MRIVYYQYYMYIIKWYNLYKENKKRRFPSHSSLAISEDALKMLLMMGPPNLIRKEL